MPAQDAVPSVSWNRVFTLPETHRLSGVGQPLRPWGLCLPSSGIMVHVTMPVSGGSYLSPLVHRASLLLKISEDDGSILACCFSFAWLKEVIACSGGTWMQPYSSSLWEEESVSFPARVQLAPLGRVGAAEQHRGWGGAS